MNIKSKIKRYINHRQENQFLDQCFNGKIPSAIYEQQCIFIHIPRTAGSSMVKAGIHEVYGHVGIDWYYNKDRKFAEDTFKFAFVRNTWDRIHSSYHYIVNSSNHSKDYKFKNEHLKKVESFEQFVLDELQKPHIQEFMHFKPQVEYLQINGKTKVDFIGKFETLTKDIEYVSERTGKKILLPHINQTKKPKYRDVYSEAMRKKIYAIYKEEIEKFEFDFE